MNSTAPPKRPALPAALRRRVLGISDSEAAFATRGFPGRVSPARDHLEQVGRTFVRGYNEGLLETDATRLGARLDATEPEWRGFAYEGAAMALGLVDALVPGRRERWRRFVLGPGAAHVYMAHVGLGWAWARLPGNPEHRLEGLDPLLGWLALDGYGFHQGYFHWPRTVTAHDVPRGLSASAGRVFDQGLGRSLWFVEGAAVERIAAAIASFPETRRGDLWSGVGLAAAYAGGVSETDLAALHRATGEHAAEAAQGAAFAAKARLHAGNLGAPTEAACRALCGQEAREAARLTETVAQEIQTRPPVQGTLYEAWRAGIRARLVRETRAA